MTASRPWPYERLRRRRRPTRAVRVGHRTIGGDAPILLQSMVTTATCDVAATVAACRRLAETGCELVRITAPTVADARALAAIRRQLDADGLRDLPLSADIHFQPAAALEALEHVEKVRINPGNFADRAISDWDAYDDAAFARDRDRAAAAAGRFFARARALGRAVRIGVNHGSLAERMMIRYGDTPAGMVASAREYLAFAAAAGCDDVVISIKSSNVAVMVRTVRLLAAELDAAGTPVPLHLGVTEAGSGREGRIKGAAGIGTLLADGIGDTIRVSLTEPPEAEIPVAEALRAHYAAPAPPPPAPAPAETIDPFDPQRRPAATVILDDGQAVGGAHAPRVLGPRGDAPLPAAPVVRVGDDPVPAAAHALVLDLPATDPVPPLRRLLANLERPVLLALGDRGGLDPVAGYRLLRALIDAAPIAHPLCLRLDDPDPITAAADAGALLIDGIGEALALPTHADGAELALTILQAVRVRISRPEYIACPGCGRTRFDLVGLSERVKAATGHLHGVTIAVMGCIVNGPGEMADADVGLIGDGPDTVALYRGREPLRRHIPIEEAVAALVALVEGHDHDSG